MNPDQSQLPEEMTLQQAHQLFLQSKGLNDASGYIPSDELDLNNLPDEMDLPTARQLFLKYGKSNSSALPSYSEYVGNFKSPQAAQPAAQSRPGQYGASVKPTALPLQGRISQGFGVPQAVAAAGEKTHGGIDIAVPVGTEIPDAVGGTIIATQDMGKKAYGKTILVAGTDGRVRRYSHLSQFNVRPGDKIAAGAIVGLSGSTGVSTGPHLDYREYIQ